MNILGACELPIMQEDAFSEQTAQSNEVFKHGCLYVAPIHTLKLQRLISFKNVVTQYRNKHTG
jgi:hypothetical protein